MQTNQTVTPVTYTNPNSGAYIGCYNDKNERALINVIDNKTYDECRAMAKNAGESVFGLQYGDPATGIGQCTFGGDLASATKYGIINSSNLPTGDGTQCLPMPNGKFMGGAWSNAVYHT